MLNGFAHEWKRIMDASTKTLIKDLKEQEEAMLSMLFSFCEIQSGSFYHDGIRRMHEKLKETFHPLGENIESLPSPLVELFNLKGESHSVLFGQSLFIQKRPELKRRILLAGHMDTVYPKESLFQELTWLDEKRLKGPGVTDMKGGLVVMFHALQQFEKDPISKTIGWDVLINTDEEIGSLSSRERFKTLAPRYQAALLFEPALDSEGTLVRRRKGSAKITMIARGRAAHSGRAFHEGRNAICYLSEAILKIDALNGKREGITFNIGIIEGGEAGNVVPETACAILDIRIMNSRDEDWVLTALQDIQKELQRPDYSLEYHGGFNRPVKEVSKGTEALFLRIQKVGLKLGVPIAWKDSGGACDGNNLESYGLPVIDTLGVRGGHIHSQNEFIWIESLVERAALTALLLQDLAHGGLEELS